MASDISVKLGIEGEAELKNKMAMASQQVKTFGAEVQAMSQRVGVSATEEEAAAKKAELFSQAIDAQKQKIAAQTEMLQKSIERTGENSVESEKWRTNIAKSESELAKMEKSLQDETGKLDENKEATRTNADEVSKASDRWASAGQAIKTAAVAIGAATAAAAAGAVALGKSVVSAFADYEQLEGGVETLFKGGASKVEQYANEAYKTAGLSANEYMEQVTGFSAALINSMGGDTEAAAEKANQAIIDMSDNANKMGSDISSLQTAYAGFAKGQYTLLDNLKLGYGGTKTEMERLLADAEKFSGIKYDISSYADIVDAIHVIQTEMDITGTTAKEADATISGSIAQTKSAYENFIAALGKGDGVEEALDNMVSAASRVVENVTPVIERILTNIPIVTKLAEAIGNGLSEAINLVLEATPQILQMGITIAETIITGILEETPKLLDAALQIITMLGEGLLSMAPTLITAATQLIIQLATFLTQNVGSLISAALTIIQTIGQSLIENANLLISAAFELIEGLVLGLIENLPEVISTATEIFNSLLTELLNHMPELIDGALQLIMALQQGLLENLPLIIEATVQLISTLLLTILEHLPEIIESGLNLIVNLVTGIIKALPKIAAAVPQIIHNVIQPLKDKAQSFIDAGMNIIDGIVQGIKSAAHKIYDTLVGIAEEAWNAVCSFFDIESPSKLMRDTVGKNIMLGWAEGLERYKDSTISMAKTVSAEVADSIEQMAAVPTMAIAGSYADINLTSVIQMDGEPIATIIDRRLGVRL